MVEERHDLRETPLRHTPAWFELFRGFQVAIDPRKLLLAAAGILTMAFGWWLLAAIFYSAHSKPEWSVVASKGVEWEDFQVDRAKWNVLHKAAGDPDSKETWEADDLARTAEEYEQIQALVKRINDSNDEAATVRALDQEDRDGKLEVKG